MQSITPGRMAPLLWAVSLASAAPVRTEPPRPQEAQAEASAEAVPADELIEVVEGLASSRVRKLRSAVDKGLEELETLQGELVARVLAADEVDPRKRPEPPELVHYDPKVHAPAEPIKRKWVESEKHLEAEQRRFLSEWPARGLESAWSYDFATGEIHLMEEDKSSLRRYRNLAHGFLPESDRAEALALAALDNGEAQALAAAFGHAYTDRQGNAYRGLTLYDVWCSKEIQEMPDVDVLGLVHDLMGDSGTWVAPLADSQKEPLYAKIGELFQTYRRHRALRENLVRVFLSAEPALRDGYDPSLDRFHALWATFGNDPRKVAEVLPQPEEWEDWFSEIDSKLDWDAGKERQRRLAEGERAHRAVLEDALRGMRVLQSAGAERE